MNIQHTLLGTTLAVSFALAGGSAYAGGLKGMMDPTPIALSGMYVSVFGGGSLPQTFTGTYDSDPLSIPSANGFVLGGAIGATIMDHLRGEVELSFSSHGVPLHSTFNAWGSTYTGSEGADGYVNTLYLLGNAWYDIDTGNNGIRPYIGGGLGAAVVMPQVSVYYNEYGWNGASVVPAAQFGAGVKIPIGSSGAAVDLGYRARIALNATWGGDPNLDVHAGNATGITTIDQTLQAGLTIPMN